jgi:hypothetical protein
VDSDSCAAGASSFFAAGSGAVLEEELGGSEASAASWPPLLSETGLSLFPPASSIEKSAKASTSAASSTRTAIGWAVLARPLPLSCSMWTHVSDRDILLA